MKRDADKKKGPILRDFGHERGGVHELRELDGDAIYNPMDPLPNNYEPDRGLWVERPDLLS